MKTAAMIFVLCISSVFAGDYKFDPEKACQDFLLLKFDETTTNWIMGYPLLPDTICVAPRVSVQGAKPKLFSGTGTTYRWVDPSGQVACLFRWKDGNAESYYLYDKREGREAIDTKPIEQIVKEDSVKAKQKK